MNATDGMALHFREILDRKQSFENHGLLVSGRESHFHLYRLVHVFRRDHPDRVVLVFHRVVELSCEIVAQVIDLLEYLLRRELLVLLLYIPVRSIIVLCHILELLCVLSMEAHLPFLLFFGPLINNESCTAGTTQRAEENVAYACSQALSLTPAIAFVSFGG